MKIQSTTMLRNTYFWVLLNLLVYVNIRRKAIFKIALFSLLSAFFPGVLLFTVYASEHTGPLSPIHQEQRH